jgi:hypothetical protein
MAEAEAADPDGLPIPDEFARREERLAELAAARARSRPAPRNALSTSRRSIRPSGGARGPRGEKTGKKPPINRPKPRPRLPLPTNQTHLIDAPGIF